MSRPSPEAELSPLRSAAPTQMQPAVGRDARVQPRRRFWSTACRAPDHLDLVRVLPVLLEAESQVERLGGVAVDDIERHRLLPRRCALEQVLDQPGPDAGAAERADEVNLAQVQPIGEFRHLDPTDLFVSSANHLDLRLFIALPKSDGRSPPVPSADFR